MISSVLVSIFTSHAFGTYHLEFFLTYSSVLFQWLHFFLRISTCFSFFAPSLSSFIIVYLFESGRGRERQKPPLKTRLETTISKHAKANTYTHSYTCRSPCAPHLRGTAAGLGGRRSHPRGRLWDPPVCRPAPFLPGLGSGLPGESPRQIRPTCHFRLRGSIDPEEASAWRVPKGRERPGGSAGASRPHLPLHPRRHWDGPATLDGRQPDCPAHPVAWVSRAPG